MDKETGNCFIAVFQRLIDDPRICENCKEVIKQYDDAEQDRIIEALSKK